MESLWSWLKTPPSTNDVLDPFGAIYLVVFGCGFLASAYLARAGVERLPDNAIRHDGVRLWANVGLWIFGPGLVFFAIRALQINPLSFGEPIWLVASVIALIVAAIGCFDWWRTSYRERLANHSQPVPTQSVPAANEERLALPRARRS